MINAEMASEIIKSRNHAEIIRNRGREDLPGGDFGMPIGCMGSSTCDSLLEFYTDRGARAEFIPALCTLAYVKNVDLQISEHSGYNKTE